MPENGDRPRGLYEAPFKVKRPDSARQTFLKHLDRCAYSGALYLRHDGGPQTPERARGEAFHDFAERATKDLQSREEPEMPPEVAKDLMQAVLEERVDLNVPASEQDACRVMAWNWGAATYLDLESIVGVEVTLEMELAGWMIHGTLDLALIRGEEAFVHDYKTSLNIEDKESYENSFQAQCYGLLMLEGVPEGEDVPLGKGLSGVHTRQLYPRYRREEDGEFVSRYTYFDRAQMHDFARSLESTLAKLEHGLKTQEWAAQTGTHCQVCPASSECPIPANLRDVQTIGTPDDAREVAQRIEFRRRDNARDTETLKTWTDAHGIVEEDDDFYWGFKHITSERKDKDAIEVFLRKHGIDPAPYLASDSKEQKAVLKAVIVDKGGDPDDFFKPSPSTRFGRYEKEAA